MLYTRREMDYSGILIGAGSLALMVMLFGAYPAFFSGMGIGRWAFILVWGAIAGLLILIPDDAPAGGDPARLILAAFILALYVFLLLIA